ncbi:UDP-N-acetylglucosamine 2-epimerase [Rhodospirillaceae bacterium LM-1]|nr:UDP-N-acetylglucosamine 2-epimerase [Rhodospirillaceae bacterium LM-1]
MTRKSVLCVVGARPNYMKIAPILAAMTGSALQGRLVHTGQHYDKAMNDDFFADLNIPEPEANLGVGSGSHAQQTADVMMRFEPVLDANRPDCVLVVGDVNSTLACALVSVKKGIPVVHVEAGLRSHDRAMPEEINRVLTDQISDLLFTTEKDALANLTREGIDPKRVHFVGNVMIDSLLWNLKRAVPAQETLNGFAPQGFGLVTLHRPSNVDDPVVLARLFKTLAEISKDLPLAFPIHPRTKAQAERLGLLDGMGHIRFMPPLGYLNLLGLLKESRLVLTDSGGLQEESTALGVACLTLRENTERPVTISEGTNRLVGNDPGRILAAFHDVMQKGGKRGRVPDLWDGQAATRIVSVLSGWLGACA